MAKTRKFETSSIEKEEKKELTKQEQITEYKKLYYSFEDSPESNINKAIVRARIQKLEQQIKLEM